MPKIIIKKKDEIIMKILHYFITEEDYKPIILTGIENEIWLENFNKNLKLIRINVNYIHNNEQYENDLRKVNIIMKNIKRKTLSFNMNMLNILVDTGETVIVTGDKNIESIKVEKVSDLKRNKLIKELFPKLKDKLNNKQTDPIEFIKLTEQMNEKAKKDEKRISKIFKNKKPIITYILIFINLLIFAFMNYTNFYSYIINIGANNYLLVKSGEIYRLFTSMFIHANIYHIFFNMYALYIIGPQVEKYFGKIKFLTIYFIGGLLGGLFSCIFMKDSTISVGASGAIFGLFGSLAYFSYKYRATLNNFLKSAIIPTIIMNFIIGILLPNIDISSHIGGLIGGLLCSVVVGINDNESSKSEKINSFIVLILMFAFLIYMLMKK